MYTYFVVSGEEGEGEEEEKREPIAMEIEMEMEMEVEVGDLEEFEDALSYDCAELGKRIPKENLAGLLRTWREIFDECAEVGNPKKINKKTYLNCRILRALSNTAMPTSADERLYKFHFLM